MKTPITEQITAIQHMLHNLKEVQKSTKKTDFAMHNLLSKQYDALNDAGSTLTAVNHSLHIFKKRLFENNDAYAARAAKAFFQDLVNAE